MLRFTILGCGSSGGVPRPGSGWGECDPQNPLNRRRRCSLLIEKFGARGVTSVLVDTGPDLREQLLSADVRHLDAVVLTHEHADHIHGIDDLRPLVLHMRRTINIHLDAVTHRLVRQRFRYIFEQEDGSSYPPIAVAWELTPGRELVVHGEGGPLALLPFHVQHGDIRALAVKAGGVVYMPDVSAIPPEAEPLVQGLDCWIIDALRPRPHPTHFSLAQALAWIERAQPRHAVLTNLHTDLDHGKLAASVPAHVRPAHDGLTVTIGDGDIRFS